MSVSERSVVPKTLLTPAGGYLTGYTHTLNPYTGCTFACSYCYVRRMPVALFRGEEWGTWVDRKERAAELLERELRKARSKGPVTIFMSSATDPYQPAEAKSQTTRSLLEVMAEQPPDFLFVQTRSPLVTRDIGLFRRFGDRIRISMTVETDREDIRKHFSPFAPPIAARLRALRVLKEEGIPTQAAVSPVLPSTESFADRLAEVTDRAVVDDFFMGDGSGGTRTKSLQMEARFSDIGLRSWFSPEAYRSILEPLRCRMGEDRVFLSRDGFMPE